MATNMRSSASLWIAVVSGVIGCSLLTTGTCSGFWLNIYVKTAAKGHSVIFGLFVICVDEKCTSLGSQGALSGWVEVWRVCAISSSLALGGALICSGLRMRALGVSRCLKIAAIFLSVTSLVAAVTVIGVFTTRVEEYFYPEQNTLFNIHVSFEWSFNVFIVGTVFTAVSTIAVILSVITEPPTEGMGDVAMRQVNFYPPGPFTVGSHFGGPTTQFQPGLGDSVYGYDQPSVSYPDDVMSGVPSDDSLAFAKHSAPTAVDGSHGSAKIPIV